MAIKYDPLIDELVSDFGYGSRITDLEAKDVRAEFYEQIEAIDGVSGTITLPTGATIFTDTWQDTYEGVATTITNGQLPDKEFAREADGTLITVDYLDNGDGTADWTLSGTPSAYPVAILYEYSVAWVDYDYTKDLNNLINIAIEANVEGRIGFSVVSNNNLSTGIKAYRTVPFSCTIDGWYLDADSSGDITINIEKGISVTTDVVGLGTKPALSSQTTNSGTAGDWDQSSLVEGDILVFSVEGTPTINQVVFTLDISK